MSEAPSPPPPPHAPSTTITTSAQLLEMSEEDVWKEGEKYFTKALEELQILTSSTEHDEESKQKIYQLLSVIEDSKAEGSVALKTFLNKNRTLLSKAKEQIVDITQSIGGAVPGSLLENIDKLKDVLMGENSDSQERLSRAKHLASEGKEYFDELLISPEAKELEVEGLAALGEIRNTAEGQRLERAVSELLGLELGTSPDEEINLAFIKNKVLEADLKTHLSNGIRTASNNVAQLNLNQMSEDAINNDKTGLLKKLSETKNIQSEETINAASEKANDLLQKLEVDSSVEDAVAKANEIANQNVSKEEISKNADDVLDNTSNLLAQAKKQRRGQRALSQSLVFLRTGMKQGYVQDAVKTFGSEEMVNLGKKAWLSKDKQDKDNLLESVRVASINFISSSLPNVEIPPISGYRENVAYTIDGLDMSGFHIGKDSIQIQPGDFASDDWDGEVLKITCEGISAEVKELTWSYRQGYFPYLSGSGKFTRRIRR
jgi:hypothetical protein